MPERVSDELVWDLKEPQCLSIARLMVAPPEFVYTQVKFYGEETDWLGKEELEKALLRRDERLINLALAQFATRREIIQQIYNRASSNPPHAEPDEESYNLGLRVACLSNRHFSFLNWPDFNLNALMARGFTPEAEALLSNPTIPTDVLASLFKKSDFFAAVDEKDWLWMIQTAARNERINIDKSTRDGPDLGLWDIHKAIFAFLETASVTPHTAHAAIAVLSQLPSEHATWPDDISNVLDRWGKVEIKDYKDQEREGFYTHLPLREELRCLIASRYSRRSTQATGARLFGSAGDEDVARRCAFYAGADLSEKEINAGFAKDKDVFLFAALKNPYVLRHPKKRAAIEEHLFGDFIHEYRRSCEAMSKRNKYFDITPVSEAGRTLLEDIQEQPSKELSLLEKISAQNERLAARLISHERKALWIVVILIVAMYLIVKR
jgi:hypothetical protein